ncbi:MAG: hypothetical protein A3E87_10935 [Gammaproteobacteria bacterium RIFCSPHIGHO2_12_FULL_35_23]|nr:MAG: hypothetical protein A3E87_10935 [Gammaproteobacteria bacterium RIFCSPHIGHO2_12_FULL_35_23]
MRRLYLNLIHQHFVKYQQMAFLCGPRQVGKTTIAQQCSGFSPYYKYLNWDDLYHREEILLGFDAICRGLPLEAPLKKHKPVIIFDELHKYKNWKSLLKGFIDRYKGRLHILVTGSARLDVYRKGGDSLVGRYFLYRAHPLTVGELLRVELNKKLMADPAEMSKEKFYSLFEFGGFPEPFLQQDKAFSLQWQRLRRQQILQEDIRALANIQEISQLEMLTHILQNQASQQLVYSNLGNHIRVADNTIRRWISILESFYYCFTLKPWCKNITRSLIKEPKIYLWDWSIIEDKGQRVENFIAGHLLKAVQYWTDVGFGEFELYFLRNKDKQEVDFLLVKNNKPWLMVEAKASYKEQLSSSLKKFQSQVKADHVLQVAFDMPYEPIDCFKLKGPSIVPAITFLSQLP